MHIRQALVDSKNLFQENKFIESATKFDSLLKNLKIASFCDPRTSLLFSHLRILMRFVSKEKLEFSNFIDQLIVIKNHFRNVCADSKDSDFICIDFNIALLKFIVGHHLDSENILKQLVKQTSALPESKLVLQKSLLLLLEIYLRAREEVKFKKCFEKLKASFETGNDGLCCEYEIWSEFFRFEMEVLWGDLGKAKEVVFGVLKRLKPGIKNDEIALVLKTKMALLNLPFGLNAKENENAKGLTECLKKSSAFQKLQTATKINEANSLFVLGQKEDALAAFSFILKNHTKYCGQNFENSLSLINNGPVVCFNFGMALVEKEPVEAFKLLSEAANYYYNKPLLWVKMGQCCVQAFRFAFESYKRGKDKTFEPPNRKICTECFRLHDIPNLKDQGGPPSKKRVTCKNCFLLIEKFAKKPHELVNNSYGLSLMDAQLYFERASILLMKSPDSSQEHLNEIILLNMTLVSFYLKNYYTTINYANQFLSLPKKCNRNILIVKMYCGMSLTHLNKANEALSVLNPTGLVGFNDLDGAARAALFNNLACVYLVKGNKEKALRCLKRSCEESKGDFDAVRNSAWLDEV